MKRLFALLMVLTMCLSMAACNEVPIADYGASKEFYAEQEPGSYVANDAEVEITIWHSLLGSHMNQLAEQYMDEHPNVKITVVEISWLDYTSKLTPALAAGTTPDIFECPLGDAADYATRKLCANLQNALIARGFDESEYSEGAMEICKYDGEIYTLPIGLDNRVLYYNKDHFAAAGLDPEQPPETWEQLIEYAEKLVRYNEDGEVIQYGFHPQQGYLPESYWAYAYGGSVVGGDNNETALLTSDAVKNGFELAYRIQEVQGGREVYENWGDYTAGQGGDAFYGGMLSMLASVTFAQDMIESGVNWGCAPLPVVEGQDRKTLITGTALALTDYGDLDRLNAALDFALWLCEYEQQVAFGSYVEDAEWNDAPGKPHLAAAEAALESFKEVRPQEYLDAIMESVKTGIFVTPCPAYPDYTTALATAFSYYMTDQKTLDDALNDAQELVQSEIENYHMLYDGK